VLRELEIVEASNTSFSHSMKMHLSVPKQSLGENHEARPVNHVFSRQTNRVKEEQSEVGSVQSKGRYPIKVFVCLWLRSWITVLLFSFFYLHEAMFEAIEKLVVHDCATWLEKLVRSISQFLTRARRLFVHVCVYICSWCKNLMSRRMFFWS